MADTRLAALKRQVALGDPNAAVELLQLRMRVGELTKEQVDLAAYLGDAAARKIVPPATQFTGDPPGILLWPSWPPVDRRSLRYWLNGLKRWKYAVIRAGVACARAALPLWERNPNNQHHKAGCPYKAYRLASDHYCGCRLEGDNRDLNPRWAIEATERWICCPCKAHSASWGRMHEDWVAEVAGSWIPSPDDTTFVLAERIQNLMTSISAPTLYHTIRNALIPLALGIKDPVRETEHLPRSRVVNVTEWTNRYLAYPWVGELREEFNRLGGDVLAADAVDERLWRERRWLPPHD